MQSLYVCLCVLCSDDNDTKCSKLLRASLRGTSGFGMSNNYNRWVPSATGSMHLLQPVHGRDIYAWTDGTVKAERVGHAKRRLCEQEGAGNTVARKKKTGRRNRRYLDVVKRVCSG